VKKEVLCIAGLLFALAWTSAVASPAPQSPSDSEQVERQAQTPDQVADMLATRLSLTDEQKTEITPIIAARQQRIREVAADESLRRGKKAREIRGVFKDSDKEIESVLNGEQKQKYSAIKEQMREDFKERREQRSAGGSSE